MFCYLVLILLISDISSNTFTANKGKFKGIPGVITYMALFKYLLEHEKDNKNHTFLGIRMIVEYEYRKLDV